MSEGTIESDKGLGIGLAFAAITLVGAVAMFGAPSQIGTAGGFGGAMVAAVVSVAAFQAFA